MTDTAQRMRALLAEAQRIADDHFGQETVANVPLLVTHIALTMTQIDEADRTPQMRMGDMSIG